MIGELVGCVPVLATDDAVEARVATRGALVLVPQAMRRTARDVPSAIRDRTRRTCRHAGTLDARRARVETVRGPLRLDRHRDQDGGPEGDPWPEGRMYEEAEQAPSPEPRAFRKLDEGDGIVRKAKRIDDARRHSAEDGPKRLLDDQLRERVERIGAPAGLGMPCAEGAERIPDRRAPVADHDRALATGEERRERMLSGYQGIVGSKGGYADQVQPGRREGVFERGQHAPTISLEVSPRILDTRNGMT